MTILFIKVQIYYLAYLKTIRIEKDFVTGIRIPFKTQNKTYKSFLFWLYVVTKTNRNLD